jgi:flavin-binding protein dodecin
MVYKYIHIVGTSPDSIAKAMEDAVDEAAKTVKSIRWAELGRGTLRIENQ